MCRRRISSVTSEDASIISAISAAPLPVRPLASIRVQLGLTSSTLSRNTSRSAWDTMSPLVITTISAVVIIGPIFNGVLGPVVASMTQTARQRSV